MRNASDWYRELEVPCTAGDVHDLRQKMEIAMETNVAQKPEKTPQFEMLVEVKKDLLDGGVGVGAKYDLTALLRLSDKEYLQFTKAMSGIISQVSSERLCPTTSA